MCNLSHVASDSVHHVQRSCLTSKRSDKKRLAVLESKSNYLSVYYPFFRAVVLFLVNDLFCQSKHNKVRTALFMFHYDGTPSVTITFQITNENSRHLVHSAAIKTVTVERKQNLNLHVDKGEIFSTLII